MKNLYHLITYIQIKMKNFGLIWNLQWMSNGVKRDDINDLLGEYNF